MNITPEKLNYLIVLAEEQNITRAARRLFITQPTLTVFLNKIEGELGIRLFDRTKSPIRLTKNGTFYLENISRLLREEQKLTESLRYLESKVRFVIGLGYVHSEMMGAPLASALVERHPDIDLVFREGKEADLIRDLNLGNIDIFIGHFTINNTHLHVGEWNEDRLFLLVPNRFLDLPEEVRASNSPDNPYMLSPDFVRTLPVIAPASSQGIALQHSMFIGRYRIRPERTIQTANMNTGVRMAAAGLGYILQGSGSIALVGHEERKELVFCRLRGMPDVRKEYYAYSDTSANLDLIRDTVDILKNGIVWSR